MKIWLLLAAIFLSVSVAVYVFVIQPSTLDGRVAAAFSKTTCPHATPREYPEGYYTGPLWDTHIHIPAIPDGPIGGEMAKLVSDDQPILGVNSTIPEIVCTFETEGTDKVFGFFPVWKEMSRPMVEVVERTLRAYPDQFVPFIMPPDQDDSPTGSPTVDAETLEQMLAIAPRLFQGYGEIGLYAREGGAAELPPDDPRLLDIYPIIENNKLLVYVHLGEGHQDNLERAAELYPEINFIFHGDQLVVYENNGYQNLDALDQILNRHTNIYYGVDELYGDDFLLRPEVSKEEFFAHFEHYEPLLDEDVATWGAFMKRHPTQVLWGTDRGWSSTWSLDIETGLLLTDYTRAFIGRLDPDIQENYAYKNAERLLNSVRSPEF